MELVRIYTNNEALEYAALTAIIAVIELERFGCFTAKLRVESFSIFEGDAEESALSVADFGFCVHVCVWGE